ncbi:MAG: glycoside hydrolase family 3 C-terminal domain-containing protein [Clostridia bacterium]|nr:glycoside hydrolase family 3 C-terminal domain-containing protein [Clostridia bacterium]
MSKNIALRVEELLSKMTVREKIGQLNQPETPLPNELDAFFESVRKGEVGSILMSVGATAGNDKQGAISNDFYNEIQRIAVEESPNGIPVLFGRDVIHGHHTVYPIPLAMAASFNDKLVEECYSDIAQEASNESIHWTFTPMLDLARDPRWGRIIEGTGEDPYVGAQVAKAVVKGLQGDDLSQDGKIVACAKHYIGYGAAEGGRDYHRTEISDYSLFNYYLPAFRAAVKAGVKTVMSSFNDVNGQPVTSSSYYLDEVLRGKLGFDGFVVSDYDAIIQLKKQGVAADNATCAEFALNAGLDMDMHDKCYIDNLEKLIEDGKVSMETLDEAVRRVLTVKMEKGLFEKPYCERKEYNKEAHLKNAEEIALESMVLLKNDNNVLPLKKDATISLVGTYAQERRSHLGSWCIDGKEEDVKTLCDALREVSTGKVWYSKGTELGWDSSLVNSYAADVVVLALGESWSTTGEARAVSDISLPKEQIELIKKIKLSGKKMVGLVFCGRPIAMQEISQYLDAIIYCWHSGTKATDAAAKLLFGEVSPSGRLPATLPRLATHIPLYYNITSSGRPVDCYYNENPAKCYVDSIPTPCYPFGFGLTYTQFKYDDLKVDCDKISLEDIKNGKKFKVTVVLENIGDFDAKETVQLYLRTPVAKWMRPLRELKAYNKVFMKKGTSQVVTFEIGFDELGYYDPQGNYTLEKGIREIYVGENCLTENKIEITVC